MTTLKFTVHGEPVPQGNHTKNRWGAIYERTKNHAEWRESVVLAAKAAKARAQLNTITDPVILKCTFWMSPPKRKVRDIPSVKPDTSKLVRAIEDALTVAGVWADDALVVDIVASKRYAEVGGAGAVIEVTPFLAEAA